MRNPTRKLEGGTSAVAGMNGGAKRLLAFLGMGALCLSFQACSSSSTRVETHDGPDAVEVSDVPGQEGLPLEVDHAEPIDSQWLDSAIEEVESSAEIAIEVGLERSAEEILQEALHSCEASEIFWDEGDLESALAALDHSYSLLLELPEQDGALLDQQRDDLRRLISGRIVEIYAARQAGAGEMEGSIQRLDGDAIDREVKRFQTIEREFFLQSYRRSGRYRPYILEELRKAGLPEELSWLPLIESGFKTRARSSAAAVGLWQFIASTGYRFGLERDGYIDERMDPEKATLAAIAYLTDLHGMFGDWTVALAAYNCGETRVRKVIRSQRVDYLDHFWDLYDRLPRETRRYAPRFFATLRILDDPAAFGIELPEPDAPFQVKTVEIERSVSLKELDSLLGLAKGDLRELNPELRYDATPRESYSLHVPSTLADERLQPEAFAAALGSLREQSLASVGTGVHRVRSGESLSTIAKRYRTSVGTLQRINGLRSAHRIYPGQQIRLPSGVAGARPTIAAKNGLHRVRSGETLSGIAARYGTSSANLQRLNGLRSADRIYPGQDLRIGSSGTSTGGRIVYTVRRGDSLWELAQKHGTTVRSIQRANNLNGTRLKIGQQLVIGAGQ